MIGALERNNPCYRERHVESSCAGELLSADTSKIGDLPDGSRIIPHAVVDTYGSYAFGLLHTSKQLEASALTLSESESASREGTLLVRRGDRTHAHPFTYTYLSSG